MNTVGLSIKLIRHYDPESDRHSLRTTPDIAIQLAIGDERDIPFAEKLHDALAFMKRRVH